MKDALTQAVITIAAGIALCILIIVVANLDAISAGLHEAGRFALIWIKWTLIGVTALGLFAGAVILFMAYRKHAVAHRRAVDGSFPLQEFRGRGGVRILVDPNRMIASGGAYHPQVGWREFDPPAGWDRATLIAQAIQTTRTAAAIAPGDEAVRSLPGYRPPSIPGSGRALAQPKAKAEESQPDGAPFAPLAQTMSLAEAMRAASGDRLVLGHSPETGEIAEVDLSRAIHVGIVGATGTGKTAGAGMLAVLQARAAGYHVAILDPKGGMDWRPFERIAEWQRTDARTLPGQMDRVIAEHERRLALCQRHGRPNIRGLSAQIPPVLLVIEEIGKLRRDLRIAKQTEALERLDAQIEELITMSRSTAIHLLIVDQYSNHWSGQLMAGTKAKLIHKIGPNQGAKFAEYKAHELADVGEFMIGRSVYQSWHTAAEAPAYLSQGRPAEYQIIEGRGVEVGRSVHPSAPVPQGGATRGADGPADGRTDSPADRGEPGEPEDEATRKRRIAFAWFDAHADELDEISHRSAADRITQETGEALGKTYAHRLRGEWEEEQAAGSRRQAAGSRQQARIIHDAKGQARQILDPTDPADAAEIERIRAEIAAGASVSR